MHDWYKAGFFSPELLVKKAEEPDYEPLAQLIRRIGNSREPFLVPQIGIPHGPATSQPGNSWAGAGPSTATAPGAQPPFANSFPSFGTTLTAEQQNALERRKQEEQYLMARQKEHLAQQQQALARQVQMGVLPNQLNHHSSAHSLHSQPSFGSITSPGGYQPSPTQGAAAGASVPGLMDNTFRVGPGPVPGLGPIGPGMDMLSNRRDQEMPAMMDRLNLGRNNQPPFAFGQQQDSDAHAQYMASVIGDRARLKREQAEHDATIRPGGPEDMQNARNFAERFAEFQDLRVQTDMEQSSNAAPPPEGVIGKPPTSNAQPSQEQSEPASPEEHEGQDHQSEHQNEGPSAGQETLSLTEQVQKAASAKHSPQPAAAWNKVEPAIFPFPPPPSQSPLPAPAAQRKPIVAENLNTESRSGAATPAADTPSVSIAPWAKEPVNASHGPSLREIQEMEAKKAAEREAAAAAARREAFEKEMQAQNQSPAVQPGLPSSSTWASGASPVTPSTANASVWIKPAATKVAAQPTPSSKKTLQQIQKEEEARKQRATAQAVAAANAFGAAVPAPSAGKRYADLASKSTPTLAAAMPAGSTAWTTVGASGKVKTPGGTTTPVPGAVRSTSSTIVPSLAKKPTVTRSATMGGQSGKLNAEEEFRKWAVNELRHDLNKGINGEYYLL
jgi:PERQ amino acid-rich with GYF domain-containing protein